MNINGKYFDLVVGPHTFYFVETKEKPQDINAFDLLTKIEKVVTHKLKYDPDHGKDEFAKYREQELWTIFNENSKALNKTYQEQQLKLNWIWRKLFSQEVRANIIRQRINTKIENYVNPPRVFPLPNETIREITKYFNLSDLAKFARLNWHAKGQSDRAFFESARELGYKGKDEAEAADFVKKLSLTLEDLHNQNYFPKDIIVLKNGYVNLEETVQRFQKLTTEAFLRILLLTNVRAYNDYFWSFLTKQADTCLKRLDILSKDASTSSLVEGALMSTIVNDKIELVETLLKRGADPNIGGSALDFLFHIRSTGRDNLNLVRLLLDYGSKINVQDPNGETPLLKAAGWREEEIVVLLLEKGADPKIADQNNCTPLHYAFTVKTAKLMLEHGADVNARSSAGSTPLRASKSSNLKEVIQFLIENGAVE